MKHLPKIVIEIIPHKKQRYDTLGDYYFPSGKTLNVRITKTTSDDEFLILIHELIEWYLTQRKGIKIEDIDKYDIEYENSRKKGDTLEPGDNTKAPYHQEHKFATKIEMEIKKKLKKNIQ